MTGEMEHVITLISRNNHRAVKIWTNNDQSKLQGENNLQNNKDNNQPSQPVLKNSSPPPSADQI